MLLATQAIAAIPLRATAWGPVVEEPLVTAGAKQHAHIFAEDLRESRIFLAAGERPDQDCMMFPQGNTGLGW
jgi:hypothetical protein